eukprot:SAG31_NODE_1144_length_9687_cov_10.800167_4_plen_341_part_00
MGNTCTTEVIPCATETPTAVHSIDDRGVRTHRQEVGSFEHTRAELKGLKLLQLAKRASDVGATAAAVDLATDAENPKAALIDLVLSLSAKETHHRVGQEGSGIDAAILRAALERCAAVLLNLLSTAPRKSRRSLQQLVEAVDDELTALDEDAAAANGAPWMLCCSDKSRLQLLEAIVAVESLSNGNKAGAAEIAEALLASLATCRDVLLQSVFLLQSIFFNLDRPSTAVADQGLVSNALQTLCALDSCPQSANSDVEMSILPELFQLACPTRNQEAAAVVETRTMAAEALTTILYRIGGSSVTVGDVCLNFLRSTSDCLLYLMTEGNFAWATSAWCADSH